MSTDEQHRILGKQVEELQAKLSEKQCLEKKAADGMPMLDVVLHHYHDNNYGDRFAPSLDILIRDDFLGTLRELATVQEQIDQLRAALKI